MNFFKKLFSTGDKEIKKTTAGEINSIYTTEYFANRYKELAIYEDPALVDGCLTMLKSYFIDNKITCKITLPFNHPANLDQAVNEGVGFHAYCKQFDLTDNKIILFLTFAFSDFLIKKYGFKVYTDKEPEFPARKITAKYDKDGTVLSLYPFEYSLKVLDKEATFEDLHNKIDGRLQSLPNYRDLLFDKEFLKENLDQLKDIVDKNDKKNT